jgi:hypothetical protein
MRSLAACWRAAWTTALMAIAVFGLMRLIPYNTLWGFATVVLAGVAAYGLLNLGFLKKLRKERMA